MKLLCFSAIDLPSSLPVLTLPLLMGMGRIVWRLFPEHPQLDEQTHSTCCVTMGKSQRTHVYRHSLSAQYGPYAGLHGEGVECSVGHCVPSTPFHDW